MEENSRFKILTIDDEAYIRQSLRTYLEDYGYLVFEAENGRKGIELFEQQAPDLVLLDLRMPEMDGLQVLEILSKKAPNIPLIVASGTGNMTSVVQALRLGAWDYIFKPIEDMTVLKHSIEKCLKESRLKQENKAYQERLEELVKERTVELRNSEQRYKAVFEYTGAAAIIIEADDTISMVNSKFAELVDLDRGAIEEKKKWYDFVSDRDIDIMANHISATKGGGSAPTKGGYDTSSTKGGYDTSSTKGGYDTSSTKGGYDTSSIKGVDGPTDLSLQYEIELAAVAGGIKFVYVSLGRIPGTDRLVASLLDVTEKKKAEQRWRSLEKQLTKSQKMEAIGTLAGGIAHDLNNILSPVLGYADMLMRTSDPESRVFQRSEKIQKAALRAADLVSQVLAFNRGGTEEKHLIRLHPVAREVVTLLKGSIPSTIVIRDRIDRGCDAVFADPTQIHQVIMNLCTNAYHAMEETGGELMVGLRQIVLSRAAMVGYPNLTKGSGAYLMLEVSDTGCGMTEDVLERIFDPYFTTKEDGKGTGLGLATAYSIIQGCHGDIRVKSTPGKGTCFTILLPAVLAEVESKIGRNFRNMEKTKAGERLLVVDDDVDIAAMCKEGFEYLGYHVDVFSSSTEALSFFKDYHSLIDLVVTDQTMPTLTGIELAREMMVIKPGLPVILCSGYAASINTKIVEDAGIKRFIMKPITVEALSQEIQLLLNP